MNTQTNNTIERLNNPPNPVAQQLNTQHSTLNTPADPGPWRGVFFDGPQPQQNADGDEIPTWCVYVGDEEAEPAGTVYTCFSFGFAQDLANRMARDRRLELIQDAVAA